MKKNKVTKLSNLLLDSALVDERPQNHRRVLAGSEHTGAVLQDEDAGDGA